MASELSHTKKIFLDAGYAIALSSVTDQYHQKTETLARGKNIPLIVEEKSDW